MTGRDPLARIHRGLSGRARVGQGLLLGLAGEEVLPEERELIRTIAPGGFLLFRRNLASPPAARALLEELASLSLAACGVPPLFAVDEEGGYVTQTDRFAHAPPSSMALAAAADEETARRTARAVGARLRWLGIPLALAPVLDVNDHAANPVIGIRSFGASPELVARYGRHAVEGLRAAGIRATGKHFPGHGSADADSHHELPVLAHDRTRLDQVELRPFREAVAAGLAAIMTAHVSYPRLSRTADLPATFSPSLTRELLRGEIGFTGLLLGDDFGMAAVREHFTPREVASLSRRAGLDLLLFSQNPELALATWEALLEDLAAGRVDLEDWEASVARVLAFKRDWLGLSEAGEWGTLECWRDGAPAWEESEAEVEACARQAAARATATVWETPGPAWAPGPGDRVGVVVTPGQAGGSEFSPEKVAALLEAYPGRHELVPIAPAPQEEEIRRLLARASRWDRLLILVFIRGGTAAGLLACLRELAALERPTAMVSVLAPRAFPPWPSLRLHVASFGFGEDALGAAFDCLWGRATPRGRLPLTPG